MYKVILIVFIIHLSSIGSIIGQSKLNIIDSKGQKTGLWAVRINNVTKKIENYSSGIPDGFFIEFSDSGEIVNYRLYDYGVLVDASVLYTDTVFGDRIDKSLEKFTGVRFKKEDNTNDTGVYSYKNGYAHGLHRMPIQGLGYREYIYFKGSRIYNLYFDDHKKLIGFLDFVSDNRSYEIISWYLWRDELFITYLNPNNKKVLVPSIKVRSLSYISKVIKENLHTFSNDTLYINLTSEVPKEYQFIDGILEKNRKRRITQNVSHLKFTQILLLPHQEITTSAKVMVQDNKTINYLCLTTDQGIIIMDRNSFRKSCASQEGY